MSIDELLRNLGQNSELEALLRVLLAGVIGIIVGFERETAGKPAGARTYGGVAMGAAAFTVIGVLMFGTTDSSARLTAQVITGIGFLGAGTILHLRGRIIGLTTAAGMWVVAGIGMAIGYGLYVLGIGTGVALFLMLQFLDPSRLVGSWRQEGEPDGEGVDPAREADETP
jgi:putative Mg2+ transporter-C (MgtC) family protein